MDEEALRDTPPYAAVLPFEIRGEIVFDATGSRVVVCSEDRDCSQAFKEEVIDSDGHFMCPECGRLGQRMVELRSTYGAYRMHPDGWFRLFEPIANQLTPTP
jgi:hypothetical protein